MTLKQRRALFNRAFRWTCTAITAMASLTLAVLIFHIALQGLSWVDWQFLTSFQSRHAEKSGIIAAISGTLWTMLLTAAFAVPLGTFTAIYLEEYAPKNQFFKWVQINIGNLAGMPSIVYGLVGLAIFVRFFGLGQSLLAGSATLALLVLPVIVIAAQESIKAVPQSIREGAYALGARHWQVVFGQVLPAATPGIMTGVILALSRAVGETAPLVMIGALSYVAFVPVSPLDEFTVLPVQIFNWASRPFEEFQALAAGAIIVLLTLLFMMNFAAILIRQRYQRYKL